MIVSAIERNGSVIVFDDKNRQIMGIAGKLHGYTSTTVSIYKNKHVYTYDEHSHQISCIYVG